MLREYYLKNRFAGRRIIGIFKTIIFAIQIANGASFINPYFGKLLPSRLIS